MFWAKGRVIRKSRRAEEAKESNMKGLYRLIASQNQPQIKEAKIVQNVAMDIMTPKATRGPPMILVS